MWLFLTSLFISVLTGVAIGVAMAKADAPSPPCLPGDGMADPQCRAITEGFNRWMNAYIERPEEFESEWETVKRHLAEVANAAPTYGDTALATLRRYMRKV